MRGSEKSTSLNLSKKPLWRLISLEWLFCVVLKPDILLFKVFFRLKYNRTKTLMKWMCDP